MRDNVRSASLGVRLGARLGALLLAAAAALFLSGGCAATHEPAAWSRPSEDMPTHVYGSWVWVKVKPPRPEATTESFGGELIAVSADSLYVAAPGLRVVPRTALIFVRLTQFDSNSDGVAGLSVFGYLSTIANGWFSFLLTGPMWIIGGTIVAIDRSFTPVSDYSPAQCEEMIPFARFPAGFPEGIDRSTITRAPGRKRNFKF